MNILYYDASQIKLPDDPLDSDSDDEVAVADGDGVAMQGHYISIGKDSRYLKGHMMDIYVSIVSDLTHKIIIHVNEL